MNDPDRVLLTLESIIDAAGGGDWCLEAYKVGQRQSTEDFALAVIRLMAAELRRREAAYDTLACGG